MKQVNKLTYKVVKAEKHVVPNYQIPFEGRFPIKGTLVFAIERGKRIGKKTALTRRIVASKGMERKKAFLV